MDGCIFCQIVAGKSPCYKVYEDDKFFGFLDIYPLNKGHSLLVPKKHYRWVHDVEDFSLYWETARKLKGAVEKALNPKWMQYFTHGLIPHAHIHILPRYDRMELAGFLPKEKITAPRKEEMKKIAEKILKAL